MPVADSPPPSGLRVQAPHGYARTLWIACPSKDWPTVAAGTKTEFRWPGIRKPALNIELPTPVLLYTKAGTRRPPARKGLFVLERAWIEPLGALSPESLEREGFDTVPEFRRYWTGRHHGNRFDRYKIVTAYRVRPWRDGDRAHFEAVIFDRLFQEPLDAG